MESHVASSRAPVRFTLPRDLGNLPLLSRKRKTKKPKPHRTVQLRLAVAGAGFEPATFRI